MHRRREEMYFYLEGKMHPPVASSVGE
jgi:hypothetical protein